MVFNDQKEDSKMAHTAADVMLDTLIDWGVDTIFGLPGDGINGIIEAIRIRQDKIRFIQVRHEEAAAFMACGYAKYTGRLGVCLATSGPGGIHLLNGLYDAKFDGQPVLAITGMHYHDQLSTHAQQDVDLDKLFMDVAVYNARIMGPAHVEQVTNLACRNAIEKSGVAHITMPVDFQSLPMSKKQPSPRYQGKSTSSVKTKTHRIPDDEDLRKAAEILNSGKKIMILAGRGSLGCADQLEQVAEILGAPIAKPLLGKAAVPDDSVYTTGSIGLLGTRPTEEAIEECDTLFMIGTSFPYLEFLPKPGQARGVQIDSDATRIGLRYPIEAGLEGDSREVLEALIPLLKRNKHRDFLTRAQSSMKAWWDLMKNRGTRQDIPMKPQVVAWELGKLLPDDAVLACDSGTIATWWARQIPAKKGQLHSLSGTLATMACGVPYAIAAQVAYPDRTCVAFVGDGGFTMLMGELATCVKYNLPVKIVIIKNNTLGQIKWEQMVFLGNPEYGCDLQPIDFAALARAFGVKSYTITDPKLCGQQLEEAMNHPGPVVIEAVVDQLEAPMPPKVKPEQALKFAESLARGTKDWQKIAVRISASRIKEMV
jgi:pyruvate dehydrogenase (quinone)